MTKVIIDEQHLEDIADAIRAKNGSQDTYKPGEMSNAIDELNTNIQIAEENDVNFYDYDGTRVYSYTKAEFLTLESMPNNPTHEGLISQGWNWDLQDAQTQVSSGGMLDIGQMYVTDDNKLRIYINIIEGQRTINLGFSLDNNATATIEWGDEQTSEVVGTGSSNTIFTSHSYSSIGNYIIKVYSNDIIYITGNPSSNYSSSLIAKTSNDTQSVRKQYLSIITKIELSSNISIGSIYAFRNCINLLYITVPSTVDVAKRNCFSDTNLKYITISTTTTSIQYQCFNSCNLKYISIPNTVISITDSSFMYSGLMRIVLPDSITTMEVSAFQYCYQLKYAILPNKLTFLPSSVFNDTSLRYIKIPKTIKTLNSKSLEIKPGGYYFDFSSHEVIPTLANTNTFPAVSYNYYIIVPDNLYEDWVIASYWSNFSSLIIKKSDWDNL